MSNFQAPSKQWAKWRDYPLSIGQRKSTEWIQGLLFSPQSYTPSACILTLHPVILPIPYLVFSHLVELTACILCLIFHSIPCIVVGVRVCLCKCGRMHVCISVPKASVDKRDVFLDALVACAHPPKTQTVELERDSWVALYSTAQVSLLFICLILLAGKVCEMRSLEMQRNQQSVWLFSHMLCSCFECVSVFILINPPVLTAPVITKLFSMRGTAQKHVCISKKWELGFFLVL